MKKVMALAAGFLVAFAPAGTAFAGEPGGNAWGNCKHNASGGKTVLEGSRLKNDSGLGGFTKVHDCNAVVVLPPGDTPSSGTPFDPPADPPADPPKYF
jgi:hypothetical protein